MTVAFPLVDRECEDAGYVVEGGGTLFFGKVANKVAPKFVVFGHDVEEEGFDVVVEGLRAEKKLRKQTEILAVDGVLAAVDFKDGNGMVSVDLVTRWMLRRAFELVPPSDIIRIHVLKAEFTDVEDAITAVLFRVRCGVPGLDLVAPKVDAFYLAGGTRDFLGGTSFELTFSFGGSGLELPFCFGLLTGFFKAATVGG